MTVCVLAEHFKLKRRLLQVPSPRKSLAAADNIESNESQQRVGVRTKLAVIWARENCKGMLRHASACSPGSAVGDASVLVEGEAADFTERDIPIRLPIFIFLFI